MHDRQLTELFRTLETGIEFAEPEPAFADALFGRLQAEARPARWSRSALLLVAALLAVALAVGIAIGSGLIELPSQEDNLLPVHGLDCPPATPLAEGVILRADVGMPDWGVLDTGRPGSRLTVYEDGTVLVGPENADPYAAEPFPALTDGGSGHSYQRLSATGIERLRSAVAESGLLARDCHLDLLASNPLRGISVRSADGAYAETGWGQYGGFIRVMTAEEQAAAAILLARLEDLGAWLPSDAWIEQGPQPFADERWLLSTERIPSERSYESDVDPSGIPRAALARDFALPGGDNLLTFGTAWTEPDIQPPGGAIHFTRDGRCEVVSLAEARSAYDALQALVGEFTNGRWWLADEGDWIAVGLRPLIPPHRDCTSETLGIYDPTTPGPSLRPPTESELNLEPCGLISVTQVSAALDVPPEVDIEGFARDDFRGHTGYLVCTYQDRAMADPEATSMWGGQVTVAVRGTTATAEQAPGLAQMWLGEAFDDTIEGQPMWLNGCMTSAPVTQNVYCGAAAAVFADPYFFLIQVDLVSVEQSEDVARALIPAVLSSLREPQGETAP